MIDSDEKKVNFLSSLAQELFVKILNQLLPHLKYFVHVIHPFVFSFTQFLSDYLAYLPLENLNLSVTLELGNNALLFNYFIYCVPCFSHQFNCFCSTENHIVFFESQGQLSRTYRASAVHMGPGWFQFNDNFVVAIEDSFKVHNFQIPLKSQELGSFIFFLIPPLHNNLPNFFRQLAINKNLLFFFFLNERSIFFFQMFAITFKHFFWQHEVVLFNLKLKISNQPEDL